MKFNIKKNTRCIFALSIVLVLLSLLTFFPVNNLNFLLDITGYACRYGSVIVFIIIMKNAFKTIKENDKTISLYIGVVILFISYLFYLICFCINVINLFL